MKSAFAIAALLLAAFLTGSFFLKKTARVLPAAATAADPMLAAAQAFEKSLSGSSRTAALLPFDSLERENWHFTAKDRRGLSFQKMNAQQRLFCLALVKTGLSERGFETARQIMEWEQVISDLEGRPVGNDYRNPELYYLSIFGAPAADQPWGWRFEGHHLSLNYTSVTGKLSVTPSFFGANPARIPSGEHKGERLLPQEEDMARHLMRSFDEAQRRMALIAPQAFDEIVTGAERIAFLKKKEGLPWVAMEEHQQEMLEMLLKFYLGRMPTGVADQKWEAIRRGGLENLNFAWAGGILPGEKHYYRIHGKSFVIEYDCFQEEGNHTHTVWREFGGDFGRDLLREHYLREHRD